MSRLDDAVDGEYFVRTMCHLEPISNSAAFDGWDLEYTQLSNGGFRCDSREVRFGGVQIYTETNNATTHQTGVAWENAFTFIVPGEMREAGRVNGQRWHETVVAFHGAREFSSRVPPMSLRAVSVAQSLALSCWEVARTVDFASRLTRNIRLVGKRESTRMAAGQITELVSLCVERPDVLALAPARAAFTRELLDLLSPFVSDDDESGVPVGDSRRRIQIVRRAREFSLEHIDTPLRVSDVCQAMGISRRTLQYSFELELGINPVAYLRLMRLNGARRDLLFPCPEWQVKDVAARWGFWHWSRFSCEYRAMFGELPSQTLYIARNGGKPQ
ncbi:MAG TPA: helix-turn-helix domain-containing protein [Trinickia sp.]|uniref:helix-turn-helix domain-containing protein n=1 Tax=Trinickia sp. TaxID=2571163 RepID=UPI002BBC7711|nr:helix-turn-helix domain-containing protein [Trinickia sp.]HVW51967.1 helix-turn-helix domain-containing protein [Trinickia sp.]